MYTPRLPKIKRLYPPPTRELREVIDSRQVGKWKIEVFDNYGIRLTRPNKKTIYIAPLQRVEETRNIILSLPKYVREKLTKIFKPTRYYLRTRGFSGQVEPSIAKDILRQLKDVYDELSDRAEERIRRYKYRLARDIARIREELR